MSNNDSKFDEAETLFEMLIGRYGDRLDSEQLKQVCKGVKAIVEAAETLRSVTLKNSDEPFSVFSPYDKDE